MGRKSGCLVARLAMELGGARLSDYGAVTSLKAFTQRQLMAWLVLRAHLRRSNERDKLLETSEALRADLGMKEKLSHYSTLAKFCERSAGLDILGAMLRRLGQASLRQKNEQMAVDATGLDQHGQRPFHQPGRTTEK